MTPIACILYVFSYITRDKALRSSILFNFPGHKTLKPLIFFLNLCPRNHSRLWLHFTLGADDIGRDINVTQKRSAFERMFTSSINPQSVRRTLIKVFCHEYRLWKYSECCYYLNKYNFTVRKVKGKDNITGHTEGDENVLL